MKIAAVAASFRRMQLACYGNNLRLIGLRPNTFFVSQRFASDESTGQKSTSEITVQQQANADYEAKLSDVSRLSEALKRKMRGEPPKPKQRHEVTREYQRMLFGKYGRASGVDPRICWPEVDEIVEEKEKDALFEVKLPDVLHEIKTEREAKQRERQKLHDNVEKQMNRMPQMIAEYERKTAKRLAEQRLREAKRQELVDEAEEFFGHRVDPRDEKFKQLKQIKDEAALKAKKEARKMAKTLKQ